MTTPFQPEEDEQTLSKGFEKNEAGTVSYPLRFLELRQKAREYLKQLYTALKPAEDPKNKQ